MGPYRHGNCRSLRPGNRLHRQRRAARLQGRRSPLAVAAARHADHTGIAARPLHRHLVARVNLVAKVDRTARIYRLDGTGHRDATDHRVHRHRQTLDKLRVLHAVGCQGVLTDSICRHIPLPVGLLDGQACSAAGKLPADPLVRCIRRKNLLHQSVELTRRAPVHRQR